ncbi:MAG: hypothetical protein IJI78_05305 [Oscillospiraceae bacterium]|nr:hypothetical protein [Oscillospiraceae bacterium]
MSFEQIWNTGIRAAMILLAIYVVVTNGEGLFPRVKRRFTHRSYADKGLWFGDEKAEPNSYSSVMYAADLSYGSRVDVRLTKDGKAILFGEDSVIDQDGSVHRIRDLEFKELSEIQDDNGKTVTKLEDVLTAMEQREKRAPLLLNLHPDSHDPKEVSAFCDTVTNVFYPYRFFCAVESHNLDVIHYYAKNYSNIVRGMLMLPREESDLSDKEFQSVNRMMSNMKTRPQFFDTTKELYSRYYWAPVTMGSFVILRGVTDEASRSDAKEIYGVESVIFSDGKPKAEF